MSPGAFAISVRQAIRPARLRGAVLRDLARRAASVLAPAGADLRILVVGDAAMSRWNGRFLGRPRATNVISFGEEDGTLSGDIVVSAPTCLRETAGWPGSPEERVFFFVLHGMLHILGHDHESGPGGARRMRRLELRIYRNVVRERARGSGR
jgi:rRNA maturation RNase YbeY